MCFLEGGHWVQHPTADLEPMDVEEPQPHILAAETALQFFPIIAEILQQFTGRLAHQCF